MKHADQAGSTTVELETRKRDNAVATSLSSMAIAL